MATTDEGAAGRKRGTETPTKPSSESGTFSVRGDYWTLGYGGTTFPLKDIKGLCYIQRLLQHPGEEFHSLDLLSGPGLVNLSESEHGLSEQIEGTDRVGGLGDSGEMLDAQAKQEYKRKLVELNDELADQRERGNHRRAEQIESEIDFLNREIARAVGIGGRDRHSGSASERARLNVKRAITAALQKISEQQAAMGALLDRSIRTGSFCSYVPDPRNQVTWQFSTESAESSVENVFAVRAFSPGESSFVRTFSEGTTFVGREGEQATLARSLEQALNGEGSTVLIGGTAGVGKTRIAAEICAKAARRGIRTFVGSCYDRHEPVPFNPFVEILEEWLAQTRAMSALREALGNDAPEVARLLPQLRRMFPDIPPPLELPPEQSRRILFGAVTDLLVRVARSAPIVLLLDDMHWADEGTLLLLSHLAKLAQKIPVLIVCTYRDFGLDPGSQFVKTLAEMIRAPRVRRIALGGLPKKSVAEMLQALSGREPPESIVNLFYADTEGNPFFVEELFRHLRERGDLVGSGGEFRGDLKLADVDAPQSVRLVIGRRLARLSEESQKILSTAAVIGRFFTFQLLEASTGGDADSLLDCVEEAEKAGLISSTVQYPEARFDFSHELIRQTVVGQVSAARRQRLHLDVAKALEAQNANALEEVANDLAHHLLQAGTAADAAKTIRFLSMAARRTRLQGAFNEAADLYRDALTVLKRMPESHERDQLELGLQLTIGAVLMATRGFADTRTIDAYQRAMSLGERLGDPTQVVFALTGLVTPALLRGELDAAQAIADKALAAARSHGKSRTQIWGHHIAGVVLYHRGEFASAWDCLNQGHAEYREEEHTKNPQDPGIQLLEYMALTAWQIGLADTARKRMQEAVNLSERLQKPFGIGRCSFYAGYLQALLRDPVSAQQFSERAIKWCSEYSIPLYLDASRIVYGWAIAQQGRGAEGAAGARAALESFKAAGNRLGIGAFLGFLAEMYLSADLPEEASATVEEGFSLVPPEPFDISYLWWLRGRLFLENAVSEERRLDKSRLEDAEKSFRTALSLATNVGAKSYQLRSATSLGRLLAARGKAIDARAIVAPLLESMTEGFDTREFVDAKRLMEELS